MWKQDSRFPLQVVLKIKGCFSSTDAMEGASPMLGSGAAGVPQHWQSELSLVSAALSSSLRSLLLLGKGFAAFIH